MKLLPKKTKFGWKRFKPQSYQKAVGMNARLDLHKNSIELRKFIIENVALEEVHNIYELGSGPGRNLFYIYDFYPDKTYICNDLSKEDSLREMNPLLAEVINFHEGDSEDVVKKLSDIDLFIVSDHLMHLQYEKADAILNHLIEDLLPNYIVLRELKEEFEDVNHPRLYHDYDQLLKKYDLINEKSSKQDNQYFLKAFKKKSN